MEDVAHRPRPAATIKKLASAECPFRWLLCLMASNRIVFESGSSKRALCLDLLRLGLSLAVPGVPGVRSLFDASNIFPIFPTGTVADLTSWGWGRRCFGFRTVLLVLAVDARRVELDKAGAACCGVCFVGAVFCRKEKSAKVWCLLSEKEPN